MDSAKPDRPAGCVLAETPLFRGGKKDKRQKKKDKRILETEVGSVWRSENLIGILGINFSLHFSQKYGVCV